MAPSVPFSLAVTMTTQRCIQVVLFCVFWLCCTTTCIDSSVAVAFGTHSNTNTKNKNKNKNKNHAVPYRLLFRRQPMTLLTRNVAISVAMDMTREGKHQDALPPTATATFPKTQQEYAFIQKALLENVMFTTLPDAALENLIMSCEKTTVHKGQVIVTQGSPCQGDYVYLVAEGDCTVVVNGKLVPEPYGTLRPMAIFGELGVIYNRTRAATITAKSDAGVVLYRIHGDAFKTILNPFIADDDPELLRKIDNAIDQVAGTKTLYGGHIIRQYKPSRSWLWKKWKGTVFQHTWRTVGLNMLLSLLFIVCVRQYTDPTWLTPDKSNPIIHGLDIIRRIWAYQMSLTTFILTFFVNQG
jgi:Cyclic nucleotide-binding domain